MRIIFALPPIRNVTLLVYNIAALNNISSSIIERMVCYLLDLLIALFPFIKWQTLRCICLILHIILPFLPSLAASNLSSLLMEVLVDINAINIIKNLLFLYISIFSIVSNKFITLSRIISVIWTQSSNSVCDARLAYCCLFVQMNHNLKLIKCVRIIKIYMTKEYYIIKELIKINQRRSRDCN